MKVPSWSSAYARRSSSGVFMTMGPYHATGSSIGFPDTRRNRIPASPACTVTASPLSNSTSERFCTSPLPPLPLATTGPTCSVRTAPGSEASRNVPPPSNTGKRVPRRLDRQRLALARRDPHVEIARVRRHPFDRTGFPPKAAADHADARAVVVGHLGDVAARDVLVARARHLQGRRQVGPELEAVHASPRVAARHLLMEDPAARGHPLHVTRSQGALVTEAVTVVHRPREHVGDGFDPTMGVPGEPRDVILGVVVTKVVEQEKGIEFFGVAKAERAAQPHAGALDGRLRLDNSLDWSNGHDGSSDSQVAALWWRTPAAALGFRSRLPVHVEPLNRLRELGRGDREVL